LNVGLVGSLVGLDCIAQQKAFLRTYSLSVASESEASGIAFSRRFIASLRKKPGVTISTQAVHPGRKRGPQSRPGTESARPLAHNTRRNPGGSLDRSFKKARSGGLMKQGDSTCP
jgi:hypothetical protein